MRLSGIDLRVLPGAVSVYCFGPIHHRHVRPTEQETTILIQLADRVSDSREDAYKRMGTESHSDRAHVIAARLAVALDVDLSDEERRLIVVALEVCALEWTHGGDVNILFNGDEYGVTATQFTDLARRLKA